MEEFSRFSDSTEAMRTIKNLTDNLNEAQKNISKWMINFDVEINISTLDIRISAIKPNGGGVIKTLLKDEVMYNSVDISGLTNSIVDEIYSVLLKEQMYNQLHDKLLKASLNVCKMKDK